MNTFISILSLAAAGEPVHSNTKAPEWVLPGRCGANALYIFLTISSERALTNSKFAYEDVTTVVPTDPSLGCSLADIAEGAKQLGLDVEVKKVPLNEFRFLETPYIAHIDNLDQGSTGHFVTVYAVYEGALSRDVEGAKVKGTFVKYIDGSDGLEHDGQIETLSPNFSGFVLIRSSPNKWISSPLKSVFVGLISGCFLGIVVAVWKANRKGTIILSK